MTREELIQKIAAAKAELKIVGPIHRRNLQKYIHRMEIALKRFHHDDVHVL